LVKGSGFYLLSIYQKQLLTSPGRITTFGTESINNDDYGDGKFN